MLLSKVLHKQPVRCELTTAKGLYQEIALIKAWPILALLALLGSEHLVAETQSKGFTYTYCHIDSLISSRGRCLGTYISQAQMNLVCPLQTTVQKPQAG